MSTYSIQDLILSTDRHKLYTLVCSLDGVADCISWLQSQKIPAINVGMELSAFISELEDHRYLNIEVLDHISTLIAHAKTKINNTGNDIVAIYNLGILLEPSLALNAAQLLKDFSKTTALIIIWDHPPETPDRLHWSDQHNNIFLDFAGAPLKRLQYEI